MIGIAPGSGLAWAVLLILPLAVACRPSTEAGLSAVERDTIAREINQVLQEYRATALRQDLGPSEALRAFLDFYSKDLVLAGDGKIQGGYDQWSELLKGFIEEREKMLSWDWQNIHVDVLSRDAAASTFEFEHSELKKTGAIVHVGGAWTYVFRRDGGKWRIVHTNGTHTPL